ncbi:MAG: hypothetical protein O3C22_05005 [Bacteroidetes bacterium]|nr:hypothetical protein [Bacteroidota bacterium]MDA0943695.1 hypothetical protein [Bacteroidota bacterium]MDA1111524.1 hypothetical protein [Bacteroidota bacterium]
MTQALAWPVLTHPAEHTLMSHLVSIRTALVQLNRNLEEGEAGLEAWKQTQRTWTQCLRAQSQWNAAYREAQLEEKVYRRFAQELDALAARLLCLMQAFNG